MSESFYDDPAVFDILHAPGTAREVDGLERIARKFCRRHGPGSTWLEPACGTGRYLLLAMRRGYRVIGFDLSPAMVGFARRKLAGSRRGRFLVAEMTRFASVTGRADFAFCPINTIRHLPSDRAMIRHLREIRQALRPGGVYAVGVSTTAYGLETPAEDVWEGRRGSCRVKQIVEYLPPRTARDRREQVYSHLVITRGGREEHRDHHYTLRCYSTRQWGNLVTASGMEVVAVTDDRGEAHEPGAFGYAIYILGVTRSTRSG